MVFPLIYKSVWQRESFFCINIWLFLRSSGTASFGYLWFQDDAFCVLHSGSSWAHEFVKTISWWSPMWQVLFSGVGENPCSVAHTLNNIIIIIMLFSDGQYILMGICYRKCN
jgi:hypothetical protein